MEWHLPVIDIPPASPEERTAAHNTFRVAISNGTLTRPQVCDNCRRPYRKTLHGHHWRGYAYPLDVQWLCQQCHSYIHPGYDKTAAMSAHWADMPEQEREARLAGLIHTDGPATWEIIRARYTSDEISMFQRRDNTDGSVSDAARRGWDKVRQRWTPEQISERARQNALSRRKKT